MNQAAETNITMATGAATGRRLSAPQLPKHWPAFQHLSCQLSLEIPVPGFTIATLLRLSANDVVNTHWLQGSDVPLHVNGKLIGWTEFEVIDDHLATRLTQIA
jgi:flagellar motor switch/type III secretory pathway protein FliN